MSLKTGNFYKEIDKIRKSKGMSTSELTKDIMSERTYYRHLAGDVGIKYSSLQAILSRLNMDIVELLIQDTINNNQDDKMINSFVYRLYSLSFSEIRPLLARMEEYHSDNLLLQRFVEINLLKYRYITKQLPRSAYSKLLRKALSDLSSLRDTNVYKLYINMESFVLDYKTRKINKVNELVKNMDFAKNPLYSIIILDNYLYCVIKNNLLNHEEMLFFYKKYRNMLRYYNIIRPFTKLDLYRAYIEKYNGNDILMKKYLIKYINGIIVTDSGKYFQEEINEIKEDFGIEYKSFLNENKDLVFNNPDSRFRIVKELDYGHKEISEVKK